MPSLLYVCTGNVCRSPFAERLTRRLFDERGQAGWSVGSVGTSAMSGHPMDRLMAQELEQRGGSAEGFQARQATFDRFEDVDLILPLTAAHREWVLEESPALLNRTFTLGQLARFAQEEGSDLVGEDFMRGLRRHRSRARRRDDVPDPFRRGPEAAAQAATHITDLLDVLVPRLIP